jgi:16S rRNA (guanine966-N2)-methyltransferase
VDLYAGSGALGFEALSRGARKSVFVEANAKTAMALRTCAIELGVEHESRVIVGRVDDVLTVARLGGPFDVIFADPPYEANAERSLVATVGASGLLGAGGTLVVERESRHPLEPPGGPLALVRTVAYGRTALDFFKYR